MKKRKKERDGQSNVLLKYTAIIMNKLLKKYQEENKYSDNKNNVLMPNLNNNKKEKK